MTDPQESQLASSPIVTTVFERILDAVNDGTLVAGQRLSDAALAQQFGVSRTPVREALQRLREIGVVEASASRFTRVADVTPEQTAQAYTVWLALYAALVEEVVPRAPAEVVRVLEEDHARYLASLSSSDPQRIATANYLFVSRLPQLSHNPALQRAITSVVHVVRLGSLHLPDYIDLGAVAQAQGLLVDAVRERDVAVARQAIQVLRGIEVPLE